MKNLIVLACSVAFSFLATGVQAGDFDPCYQGGDSDSHDYSYGGHDQCRQDCLDDGYEWCRKNKPHARPFENCIRWFENVGCRCAHDCSATSSSTSTTTSTTYTTTTTYGQCELEREVCGDQDYNGYVSAVDAQRLLHQAIGLRLTPYCECQGVD